MKEIIKKGIKKFDPTGCIYTETRKLVISILEAQIKEWEELDKRFKPDSKRISASILCWNLINKNKELIKDLK